MQEVKTMSKIKIGTDSTADIPKPFCEELNISVLPLSILAGEKEYQDGVVVSRVMRKFALVSGRNLLQGAA